jgi:hypothetical protein
VPFPDQSPFHEYSKGPEQILEIKFNMFIPLDKTSTEAYKNAKISDMISFETKINVII